MKAFLIPMLVLLASCGTSHKVFHSEKKTVDSSSTVIRDTSHVSHEISNTDNLNVQNVHIRMEYAADTALAKAKGQPADNGIDLSGFKETVPSGPYTLTSGSNIGGFYDASHYNAIAQAIKDAIAASGGAGRLPSSITVDIGSISDSSSHTDQKDSGAAHSVAQIDLHKTEVIKNKDVTRTGLSLGLKIGIGIFILIILLVVAWRLARKFKII